MKLFTTLLLLLHLLHQTHSTPSKISLKVNLAGPPLSDFLSEQQVLDLSDFSKNVARIPIQNTDQPQLFQSQRFSRGTDFTLRIPVPDGVYRLTLLFAETFQPACVPGGRVFDIALGTPLSGVAKVVDAFDLFQEAGCAAAYGKVFENVPSKQGIVLHLVKRNQHPSLAGFIVEGFAVGGDNKAVGLRLGEGAEEAAVAENEVQSHMAANFVTAA